MFRFPACRFAAALILLLSGASATLLAQAVSGTIETIGRTIAGLSHHRHVASRARTKSSTSSEPLCIHVFPLVHTSRRTATVQFCFNAFNQPSHVGSWARNSVRKPVV